ncbi:MAG: glycerol-3-phosphate acyltransferase, partial [Armatimonadota bacterium]|nr:glycerol-3-phosphate acyltransferase [Armatimonadota bacterium]
APVLAAARLDASPALAVGVGLAAIAGHNWSIFLHGKGGKGIATSYGVLLGLSPLAGLIAAGLWISIVVVTRYASLASLAGVLSVPLVMLLTREPVEHLVFGVVAAGVAVYRHRANIQRLVQGEELPIVPRRRRPPSADA